jgi:hypothetical protein
MVLKAIRATYDGQSFRVSDPIDIAPNSECIIYVEEVQDKKTEDAIDYLFSIAGRAHGPPDQSVEHDHYLYGTPKKVMRE